MTSTIMFLRRKSREGLERMDTGIIVHQESQKLILVDLQETDIETVSCIVFMDYKLMMYKHTMDSILHLCFYIYGKSYS